MSAGPFSQAFDAYWRNMTWWNAPCVLIGFEMLAERLLYGRATPLFTADQIVSPQLRELDQYFAGAKNIKMLPSSQYIAFELDELGPAYRISVCLQVVPVPFIVGATTYNVILFHRKRPDSCCLFNGETVVHINVASMKELTPAFIREKIKKSV